jgi:hypothetical protein
MHGEDKGHCWGPWGVACGKYARTCACVAMHGGSAPSASGRAHTASQVAYSGSLQAIRSHAAADQHGSTDARAAHQYPIDLQRPIRGILWRARTDLGYAGVPHRHVRAPLRCGRPVRASVRAVPCRCSCLMPRPSCASSWDSTAKGTSESVIGIGLISGSVRKREGERRFGDESDCETTVTIREVGPAVIFFLFMFPGRAFVPCQ